MEGKIPLPTDNIYKFYALFGLVLLISCIAFFLYLHKTTNEQIAMTVVSVAELEAKSSPTAAEVKRREMLEKQMEIAVADRKFVNQALSAALGVAIVAVVWGFFKWHYVVQPKQDRLLDLQIAKAEQELKPTPVRGPFRRTRGGG